MKQDIEQDDDTDGMIDIVVMGAMFGGGLCGLAIGAFISASPHLANLAIGGAIGIVTGGIVVVCIAGLRQNYCQTVEMNNPGTKLSTAPPQTVTITIHPKTELQVTNSSPSKSDSLIKVPVSNTSTTAKISA